MLCLIVQTKRLQDKKGKSKRQVYEEWKKENDPLCVTDKETEDGPGQSSNSDQDSDVSSQEYQDEEIDKSEKEEE